MAGKFRAGNEGISFPAGFVYSRNRLAEERPEELDEILIAPKGVFLHGNKIMENQSAASPAWYFTPPV